MKFGHEFEEALAREDFPKEWLHSAIDYKHLKKCIKKVNNELAALGLDAETTIQLSKQLDRRDDEQRKADGAERHEYYSAVEPHLQTIPEEFAPQLRVLVDGKTGMPLDATLAPETKARLQELVKHETVIASRHVHLGHHGRPHEVHEPPSGEHTVDGTVSPIEGNGIEDDGAAQWVQIPLASAKHFFELLAPKLEELEQLRGQETERLEGEILDLGDAVEDVIEPVREGFEAKRDVSYRDLYFWREMFRLYLETPVFYSTSEQNRGALTFADAKKRLQAYDRQIRDIGLLAKMKTLKAKRAAQMFLDLNLNILKIMHFQEMNARAMSKILKKFDKRTHLEGERFLKDLQGKYPALLPPKRGEKTPGAAAGFASSIARDLHAELSSKVLSIVPQINDWMCPVCMSMAWRPVKLGCCAARFCIRCVIKLQDEGHERCPACNAETVMKADGRNIDFEAMDFLEKYFKLEVKKRQKENEEADLARRYGEEFVAKPQCSIM